MGCEKEIDNRNLKLDKGLYRDLKTVLAMRLGRIIFGNEVIKVQIKKIYVSVGCFWASGFRGSFAPLFIALIWKFIEIFP